jgi:hypothetical protein
MEIIDLGQICSNTPSRGRWLTLTVVIAFQPNAERVAIIAVFYGGQDYEASLLEGDAFNERGDT